MREFRSYGSVRGALGNGRPYREHHHEAFVEQKSAEFRRPLSLRLGENRKVKQSHDPQDAKS